MLSNEEKNYTEIHTELNNPDRKRKWSQQVREAITKKLQKSGIRTEEKP